MTGEIDTKASLCVPKQKEIRTHGPTALVECVLILMTARTHIYVCSNFFKNQNTHTEGPAHHVGIL